MGIQCQPTPLDQREHLQRGVTDPVQRPGGVHQPQSLCVLGQYLPMPCFSNGSQFTVPGPVGKRLKKEYPIYIEDRVEVDLYQSQQVPLGIMFRPAGSGIERPLNTIDGFQEKSPEQRFLGWKVMSHGTLGYLGPLSDGVLGGRAKAIGDNNLEGGVHNRLQACRSFWCFGAQYRWRHDVSLGKSADWKYHRIPSKKPLIYVVFLLGQV